MRVLSAFVTTLLLVACARTPDSVPPPDSPQEAATLEEPSTPTPDGPSAVATESDHLKPSYVMCEAGGQLRWFIKVRTISELYEPHPSPWKMEIYLNGSPYSPEGGSKALARGWCSLTDSYLNVPVTVLQDCNATLPMPNGGCRKISVESKEWYTFGDAIEVR